MPATRSTTRAVSGLTATVHAAAAKKTTKASKRNAATTEIQAVKKQQAKKKASEVDSSSFARSPSKYFVPNPNGTVAPTFLPAVLSFSLHDAKNHLINADPRFEDVFNRMECRPFEQLERVDPFRTLTTSILGQQISWMAARSITHRFRRLFNPELPEKPYTDASMNDDSFFPTADQVCGTDVPTLRSAGLSARKAEYVIDLASRFADGRLSAAKILEATDEELAEMLIAVRGIGKWTVDMFAIFSLRRPDILPVGDLGVQRGLIRWFLALHSPKHPFMLSPSKLPKPPSAAPDGDTPASGPSVNVSVRASTPDASSVPPAPVTPKRAPEDDDEDTEMAASSLPAHPQPFTPSINRTLNKTLPGTYKLPPLPAGLSVEVFKSRLTGKNKLKGAMLTPKEMDELTASWRPYRSLGVYYMWALAEDKSG